MLVRVGRCLLLTAALLTPTGAMAAPISFGTWSAAPAANNNQKPFWDGASWDCWTCGVGHVLAPYGPLEYLHDETNAVAFSFSDPAISWGLIWNQTAWTGGILEFAGGAFTYDNRHGNVYSSLTSPWQFALFRQVGQDLNQYFLGIEDISLSARKNDRDYNDFVVGFSLPNPRIVSEPSPDVQTVPEPSTLVLMGTALIGVAARRLQVRRRLHKTARSS